MPSALTYLNPNDRARKELGGEKERKERERVYNRNLEYHKGNHPEWLLNAEGDDINDNITVNVTKQAIDRTLSFLFPDLPNFQLDLNNETDDEKWLNSVFRYNGGALFLSVLAQNGALMGHNYLKVLRPQTDADFPRLVSMNPTVPITYWKADDIDTVLWHELKWTVGKQELLQDYVNLGDHWEIVEYQRQVNRVGWSQVGEVQMWNAPYPPMIHAPHLPNPNQFYGSPEITENSIDLNNAINRVASDIGKILRYHASPRTVAIGVNAQKIIPSAIDGLWVIDDKDAKVQNLEMQSDLSSSMNFLTFLNDMFLAQSRVVIMRGTVKDFQRVTNTGIRAVFLDMIAKNELLRWSYGILLQKTCQTLLWVGKKNATVLPTVTWADPLPTDDLEVVNKLSIEQGNGWIDPESVSRMRGYEWGVVKSRWAKAGSLDFVKKLILKEGKPQGNSGQATRQAKTNNNSSVAP